MDVVNYTDQNGRDLIDRWFHTLRDKRVIARIVTRVERLEGGEQSREDQYFKYIAPLWRH